MVWSPFRRNTDDPLMRLLLDKYHLNLLSIPRENASVGDVYTTDGNSQQHASPPGNIKYLLDPPFDFSKIKTVSGEVMADVSGTISNNTSLDFGFNFLEGFLNALSLVGIGIGAKIRANYEAKGAKTVKFSFSSPTRDYIEDPYYLNIKLQKHRIAQGHELKGRRYYLVTGLVRSPSISIVAEDQNAKIVDANVNTLEMAEGSVALSIKEAGNGEVVFTGKRSLAFGVELYELIYDKDRDQLKFGTVTKPVVIRKPRETDTTAETRTDIEPTFIGDPKEGDAFITLD
jgi:hypothetical protein